MPQEKGSSFLIVIIAVVVIALAYFAYISIAGTRPDSSTPPQQAGQTIGTLSLPESQFLQNGSTTAIPQPGVTSPKPTSNQAVSQNISPSTQTNSWAVAAECNPGGGTSCSCDPNSDASLVDHTDYSEVIANPNLKNTWVNAIAKIMKTSLPGNLPIKPVKLSYTGEFKLPNLPSQDASLKYNAQTDHFMIQMYDGRDQFGWGHQVAMQAALYWQLNPWVTDTYGHVFIYAANYQLIDTGIVLPPDTNWHNFNIVADFANKNWVSVTIDGKAAAINNQPLATVAHPDWPGDQEVTLTVEAEPAWPKQSCTYATAWSIYFRNADFQVQQ